MEKPSDRLRDFPFDECRLANVDWEDFANELAATLGREEICQRMLDLANAGDLLPNKNNSVLGYVLGITDDLPTSKPPIWYDPEMPDIDIDIADSKRHLAITYLEDKYGKERIGHIGAVSLYKGPSALKEAGAALVVPFELCQAVADSLLKRSGGDARALDTLEDTFQAMPAGQELIRLHPEMNVVTRMEGHPRHHSTHAAGIVITNDPIINYVAIDSRSNTMHCDKKDAESLNLLKIDCLGLTQLSTFEYALELAGLDRLTLESIPMDDKASFDVINAGKFCGIFQFNGMALQSICKQFTTESFDDVVSITALARPGPLASGGAHDWVKRKNGTQEVKYPHPVFEPYLKSTLGIVVYQEQVMEIGRNIGGLSWEDVTQLRKAMSKSLGVEYFDQFGDKFKANARQYIPDEKELYGIWRDLCGMGSWTFCLAHAVSYAIISYQCMWLKAHHPLEFAAATLTNESDSTKQIILLREMVQEGFEFVFVDPDISTDKWTVGEHDGKKKLIGPFTNIKGIGPKTIEKILLAIASGNPLPTSVKRLIERAGDKAGSLFPISDAFERVMPDPMLFGIYESPTPIKAIDIQEKDYPVTIFCTLSKINPRDENEAINVAKRGGKVITEGPTASLNLQLTDDTDTIFGKISRWDYDELAKSIIDRGKAGKFLYAIHGFVKGSLTNTFRMVKIDEVKYIGELDPPKEKVVKEVKQDNQMVFF